jgi:hypothetical protein
MVVVISVHGDTYESNLEIKSSQQYRLDFQGSTTARSGIAATGRCSSNDDNKEGYRMRVRFFFAWYDGWIGYFWDGKKRILYICPLPWCVFAFQMRKS